VTIDFHAHLAPEEAGAPPFLRHLFDVEGYLERQAEAGIQLTVLSYALSELEGTDAELEEAKAQHEFLAGLLRDHPGRFAALAGLDPFGGAGWLDEAERALNDGFSGLCFPTSRKGMYLDAAEAQDAFALADERRAVVFLHPSESAIGIERAGDGFLEAWIGLPYDTGICVSRLLLADTMGHYPNLRIVVAHCGGVVPMLLGRLDYVYESLKRRAALMAGGGPPGGPPGGDGPPGGGPPGGGPPKGPPAAEIPEERALKPALDGGRPSERVDRLYFDTASYHPAAIRAAIAAVGAERVVVGTDYPPAAEPPEATLALIDALGLPPDENDLILSENARGLLGT
jgi:aminocarboxymuconate-semialdehyde decarboxylase